MADGPDLDGLTFLGYGPSATGGPGGWQMSSSLMARCHRCGGLVQLRQDDDQSCSCGALYKEIGASRFGHLDGDESIAIYGKPSGSAH